VRRIAGRSDGGALTLSYVIIVPVFLAGLMVIVQIAVWYLAREAVLSAARQGADAARVVGAPAGIGPRTAVAFIRSAAPGFLLSPVASQPPASAPHTVEITVSGRVPSLIPGLPITVRQTAQLPVERFTEP
jgi:Flp pilus assembly protein TadG